MAQLNDLVVTGKSRFLNEIQGNVSGTASNVTGTVAIAHGGTGATTRLGAAKNLTDETVPTPGFVVGLTDNWGKFGYTSIANLKTTIGSASAASGGTAITMCTTGEKYTWNNKLNLSGGTMTGNITYNLHEEISGGTLTCDRTTKVNERGLQYTSTQNSSINPTSNVYIGSRANDLDGMSSIVVCTGTDSTWQSGSEYRTHITPSSIQVSYGNKTQSSSVTVQSGDIMNNSKWDGTNTSLVTAVTNKLDKSGGDMTGQINFKCTNSSTEDTPDLVFWYYNGKEKARIWCDGTFSSFAGTYYRCYNNPSSGSQTVWSGRLAVTSSSDIRLKENVKDTEVDKALDVINQIKIRSFDWKNMDKHQKIGFVADELEEIDVNFVDEGSGGYNKFGDINPKSVNNFYMLGYIVKAIQELSAEVDELKAQLNK